MTDADIAAMDDAELEDAFLDELEPWVPDSWLGRPTYEPNWALIDALEDEISARRSAGTWNP